MAHDRNGNKLHKGDIVAIAFTVEGVDESDEYLNCALLPMEGRSPDGKKRLMIVNSQQVELLSRVDFRKTDPELSVDKAISDSGILKKGRHDDKA